MIHRCNICHRVSSNALTLIPEQFFKGPYFDDPQKDGEICQECQDVINEDLYPEIEDDEIRTLD